MPIDLTSVNAKLGWARNHFKTVDDEISTWFKSKPHEVLFEGNEKCSQFWLRVKLRGERPDFTRWSLMIGDCVTNLRDVLDHLVYAIAHLSTSPKPEKRDKAAFVIASCPEDFKDWSRNKLASVPDSVRDTVLGFQPFNRKHPHLPPLLRMLADLANGNKHKLLGVVLATPALIDVEFVTDSGILQQASFEIYRHDVRDGTVLCIWEFPIPDPRLQLRPNSQVGLHLAIKHKALAGNTAFDCDRTLYKALLQMLFDEVSVVIGELTKLV